MQRVDGAIDIDTAYSKEIKTPVCVPSRRSCQETLGENPKVVILRDFAHEH